MGNQFLLIIPGLHSMLKVRFTQGIMQAKTATAYFYEPFRIPSNLPIHVFVDSGANYSFIDSALVEQAEIPIEALNASKSPKCPDLSLVPPVYHDLAKLLSKELDLSQPPQYQYDFAPLQFPEQPVMPESIDGGVHQQLPGYWPN